MRYSALLLVLLLSACGGGSDNGDSSTETIVGSWEATISGTSCRETVTFNSDGTFSGTSLDEIYSGIYQTDPTNTDKEKLSTTITQDNGLPDCFGDSTDDTGFSMVLYYRFDGPDILQFFSTTDDADFIGYMTRF